MSDVLKHFGVKGMKWGVIKKSGSSSGSKSKGQNESKLKTRVKEEIGSIKRERSWKKVAGDINKLTTKDINKISNRIQMENDLKRLASNKSISSPKDKQDYRLRGKMSDHELGRKVTRLRAKESLQRNISQATRSQRDLGEKIVKTAAPLVVKKALGMKITPEDVGKAWSSKSSMKDELSKAANDLSKRNKN